MIVACQVMDPGSIPGERIIFWFAVLELESQRSFLKLMLKFVT